MLLGGKQSATVTSVGVLPPAPVGHEPPASTLKAPTLLSAADWQHGVDRWEAQWGSPRGNFPSSLILGSERVLARLLWERGVSRSFTPLGLTEIVSTRAYDVDNAINLYRVERPHRDAATRITATSVESECASTLDSELGCKWDTADAIDANSWVWRWAEYASDAMAEELRFLLISSLRKPGMLLKAFSLWYSSASWRVAMAMRSGTSWDAGVAAMTADTKWTTQHKDIALAAAVAAPKAAARPARRLSTDLCEGFAPLSGEVRQRSRVADRRSRSDRRCHRDRRRRSSSSHSQRRSRSRRHRSGALRSRARPNRFLKLARSRSRGDTVLCLNFQRGGCNKGDKCKFSHECAKCGQKGCVGQAKCRV